MTCSIGRGCPHTSPVHRVTGSVTVLGGLPPMFTLRLALLGGYATQVHCLTVWQALLDDHTPPGSLSDWPVVLRDHTTQIQS